MQLHTPNKYVLPLIDETHLLEHQNPKWRCHCRYRNNVVKNPILMIAMMTHYAKEMTNGIITGGTK